MISSVDRVRALVEEWTAGAVVAVERSDGGCDFRWSDESDTAVRVVPTELGVNVQTFTTGRFVWLDAEARFVGMATGLIAAVVVGSLLARVVL